MDRGGQQTPKRPFVDKDDAYLARGRVDVATLVDVLIVLRVLQPNPSGEGHLGGRREGCRGERGGAEDERGVRQRGDGTWEGEQRLRSSALSARETTHRDRGGGMQI